MLTNLSTIKWAELFQSFTALIAVARLISLGLSRQQTSHLAFLCLFALTGLTLMPVNPASALYFWLYLMFSVVTWVASTQVVRDMVWHSLKDYPGIQTAARLTLIGALAASFLVSAAITTLNTTGARQGTVLYYVLVFDRVLAFGLGVVIAALLSLTLHYPLRISRNTYTSYTFFSVIFLVQALVDLVDSLAPGLYSVPVETGGLLVSGCLLLGWAWNLSTRQAEGPRIVSFETPREEDLLRQLEAMNQLLSRVGRR